MPSILLRCLVSLFLVLCFCRCGTDKKNEAPIQVDPISFVNPFIGTGFHGHTFPGPTLPYGMVQLSPDTRLPGWDASSGYHYSDSTIYGFSHTHLSGTGIGDMGDVLLLPYTGDETTPLIASFTKETEVASAGYYAVDLANYGIKAELTVTQRTGMHRYTYPASVEQKLSIDLGHILQANWGHKSLECAYYDFCISRIALAAGDQDLAEKYARRSLYYKEYFDENWGFMRGKLANGAWQEPFNPNYSDHETSPYVEGNAWQWSWFVPHDIDGFINLMGGKEAFALKLDSLFSISSVIEGKNASADITGLIGQYAHGNEPSHHVIHFYNYLGQPHKAQEKIDEVLQTLYLPTPAGISGNEDCGAMSAWYVMNALGFYQVCPGKLEYSISRPMIDRAVIELENGNTFEIRVENNAPTHLYVAKVSLNGKLLDQPFFDHESLMEGGLLRFKMTDQSPAK